MMKLTRIGKIVNTHGIKGEIKILSNFPYKDYVFLKGMTIYIEKDNREVIQSYRRHKNFDMITLQGYDNINDVLKYKGKMVYVDSADIKLPNDSYLDEELIGLTVIYENKAHGIIDGIERYNKVVLFSVLYDGKQYLLPYNKEIIDKVDLDSGKIYIKDIKGFFDNDLAIKDNI